jgi:hypothetical protein
MAGTINYLYDPDQIVWVIDSTSCSTGPTVLQGTVVKVRAEVLPGSPVVETVKYDIRIGTNAGTDEFVESDVFETLGDAVVEYGSRLAE